MLQNQVSIVAICMAAEYSISIQKSESIARIVRTSRHQSHEFPPSWPCRYGRHDTDDCGPPPQVRQPSVHKKSGRIPEERACAKMTIYNVAKIPRPIRRRHGGLSSGSSTQRPMEVLQNGTLNGSFPGTKNQKYRLAIPFFSARLGSISHHHQCFWRRKQSWKWEILWVHLLEKEPSVTMRKYDVQCT